VETAVLIALIGAFVSIAVAVAAPALLLYLSGKQAERAKRLDWDRQDKVAAQVALAAKEITERAHILVASNAEVARIAQESNDSTHARLTRLQETADITHALVNSNLTERMRSELDAMVRELVALREIMELKQAAGVEPSPAAQQEITLKIVQIAEMRAQLKDRIETQAVLDDIARQVQSKE
jgi:hypothetical protein